jgi:hypothetical protein
MPRPLSRTQAGNDLAFAKAQSSRMVAYFRQVVLKQVQQSHQRIS